MTPQELKASILQLAIQGKLVPQLSEEGTGEELYSSIVFTEKKMLKPISDDEIPFDIPSSWKWIRHNELFEIVGGSQPPKSKFEDNPQEGYVRLYQIRDYGEKPVPVFVPQNLVSKFTKKGDILLARYGASVGKVFWAEDGAYNVAMAKSTPLFKKGTVLPTFVYYYYLAPLYQTLVRNNSRSAQAGFNKEDLNGLLFPLPPLAEQKRIVAKIEELQPMIDRYEQAWSKLEEFNKRFPVDMQKSILQMAIQGRLVPQHPEEGTGEELFQQILTHKKRILGGKKEGKLSSDHIKEDELPFEIPETWKWVRFGHIMINRDAERVPLSVDERAKLEKKYDYYGASGVIDKVDRYLFDKKLLLIGEDGANLLSRSTPIAFLAQGQYWVNNHAHVLDCNEDMLCMEYIMWFINATNLAPYVTGTAQPKMNQQKMNSIPIALPPLAEQKRIVAKLEEILPLCERFK